MYVLIADATSVVVFCSDSWNACVVLANKIRYCGGAVTIFKQTKG